MENMRIQMHFNNRGLKKLFKDTIVTKKKLIIGQLDPKFLASAIRKLPQVRDYTNFNLKPDTASLEGMYNSWSFEINIDCF